MPQPHLTGVASTLHFYAGIEAGDEVLEVDGQSLRLGRTRAAALELLGRGPEGSTVSVTVSKAMGRDAVSRTAARQLSASRRRDGTRQLSLKRIATPPVTVRSRPLLSGRAQLVEIDSFGSTTAAELREAVTLAATHPHAVAHAVAHAAAHAVAHAIAHAIAHAVAREPQPKS